MQTQCLTIRTVVAKLAFVVGVFISLLLLAPNGKAQTGSNENQVQPNAYLVTILRIKPELLYEWQEFRKNETIPALLKAGYKEQQVWRTAVFGEGDWLIITPMQNLPQYDNPGPFVRALGTESARAYNQKAARFIESSRTIAIQMLPDLSIAPKPGTAFKLGFLQINHVTPGRGADYNSFIKNSVLPVLQATNGKGFLKGYLRGQVSFGGNNDEVFSMVLFDSFADFAAWGESFHPAAAKANLDAKSVGLTTYRDSAFYRYVPELSIAPAIAKPANK